MQWVLWNGLPFFITRKFSSQWGFRLSSVSRFLKKFYSDQRHFKIINYFVILLWREPDFQTGNKYPITSSYSIYSNLLNHKNELTKFTPLSLKNKFTGPFHDVIITWKFYIKYYAPCYMAENHAAMSRCRQPHGSSIRQFFCLRKTKNFSSFQRHLQCLS